MKSPGIHTTFIEMKTALLQQVAGFTLAATEPSRGMCRKRMLDFEEGPLPHEKGGSAPFARAPLNWACWHSSTARKTPTRHGTPRHWCIQDHPRRPARFLRRTVFNATARLASLPTQSCELSLGAGKPTPKTSPLPSPRSLQSSPLPSTS